MSGVVLLKLNSPMVTGFNVLCNLFANKLTLNMTKTGFMLIGSRQKLNRISALPALEINGTQLNRANFTQSLGVLID